MLNEADKLKTNVTILKEEKCLHYALTSDMWSSRMMKSFMALTVHLLTLKFEMKNFCLKVKQIKGSHTAELVHYERQLSIEKWGLNVSMLSMILRNSGSNMVKACKDWKIYHFPIHWTFIAFGSWAIFIVRIKKPIAS